jgi:hypothetical protein
LFSSLNGLDVSSSSGDLLSEDLSWLFSGNVLFGLGSEKFNVERMAQEWGDSTVSSVSSSSTGSGSVDLNVSNDQSFNVKGLGL